MSSAKAETDLVVAAKPMQRILALESPEGFQLVGMPVSLWSLAMADIVLTAAIFAVVALVLPVIPFRSGMVTSWHAVSVAGIAAGFVLMVVGLGQFVVRSRVPGREVLLTIRRDRGEVLASTAVGELRWPESETRMAHARSPSRGNGARSSVWLGGRGAAVIIPHFRGRAWLAALQKHCRGSGSPQPFARPAVH